MKDVALFTISIVKKSDTSAAVRVVFDRCDFCRNAILVALKVDDAVTTLGTATLMTGGNATVVVTASLLGQRCQQRLLGSSAGYISKIRDGLEATPRACGLVLFYSHFLPFYGLEQLVHALDLMWSPSPP